jgi:chromosome partitioning protein
MRIGKLPLDTPKIRIEHLLELVQDDLNHTEYETMLNAFNTAQFYRDEVLENRDFTANQLANALRDLFKDVETAKKRFVIQRITNWAASDETLQQLKELITQ